MAHVIIDYCLKDLLCIDACPTDCIHPKKDEAKYEEVPQLYINQAECLDCAACVSVCAANAIFPADALPEGKEEFTQKNAAFFS